MNKAIEIIVTPTGETRLETKGFSGANCLEASRFLVVALGKRASEDRTAEFYRTSAHESDHLRNQT